MRVQQMHDEQLQQHMSKLGQTAGKTAARMYMVALDEAIRREHNTTHEEEKG